MATNIRPRPGLHLFYPRRNGYHRLHMIEGNCSSECESGILLQGGRTIRHGPDGRQPGKRWHILARCPIRSGITRKGIREKNVRKKGVNPVQRHLQNDVQVSLVHQNVLPAEVFRPSLPKSGYISAKSARLVHGIVVLRLSPQPSEACTLLQCTDKTCHMPDNLYTFPAEPPRKPVSGEQRT